MNTRTSVPSGCTQVCRLAGPFVCARACRPAFTLACTLVFCGAAGGASAATHHPTPAKHAEPPAQHEANETPPLPITAQIVNDASIVPTKTVEQLAAAVARAQVLLERAHFSPGEIDGGYGSNMVFAVAGFQRSRSLPPTGALDEPTWRALGDDHAEILISYTVTSEDVAGPFHAIPEDMDKKATLAALGYGSPAEAIGEKFHVSPKLLQKLNPEQNIAAAGETLMVPNVAPTSLPKAAKVVVDKSDSTVELVDETGRTLAQYPATLGSEHDPLPVGEWKVTMIQHNPKFHYNPDLFWNARPGDDKATIQPGPNNPVGIVWIDLTKEHYGIHGTPEPSKIGKTESHGCIRLTNWSAEEVAAAVAPQTPVVMQE